jgi:PAS domain S-box-containing protein
VSGSIRVIVVDDSEDDARLAIRQLKKGGFHVEWSRVDTQETFRRTLAAGRWDLVLSDHSMPLFSSTEALLILQELEVDIPFIVVSGTIGEAFAVEMMQAGASDYVTKDGFARLVTAVERALRETEGRRRRLEVESVLLEQQERTVLALESSGLGTWSWDIPNDRILMDERAHQLLGVRPGEFAGRFEAFAKQIHPDDLERVRAEVDIAVAAGSDYSTEFKVIRHDGETGEVAARGRAFLGKEGEPVRLIGVCWDISAQRAIEAELRSSRERLSAVFDVAPWAILSVDEEFRLNLFNRSAEKLFGYAPGEILGRPICELLSGIHHESILQQLRSEPSPGSVSRDGSAGEELECLRSDGSRFPAEMAISSQALPEGTVRTVMIRDISHQRQLEEQLLHSQKMEAIGRLAGGVAHDFNNLLTAILGYCQIIEVKLGPRDPLIREISEVRKAGERAALLTGQLLAFSRKQVLQPKLLVLDDVVRDMQKMLQRLISEDIDLTTVLNAPHGALMADPGQIGQVLMNLVVNARDAMPSGGRLRIETGVVSFATPGEAPERDLSPGDYIRFVVTDTGCGMDEETSARLFEPFYTTKPTGEGTGLGLSTVYGIVAQSGGRIFFRTAPGAGTSFSLYFPLEKGTVEDSDRVSSVRRHGSGETILLVEDEEQVRVLARSILETCGYKVLEARNGKEALEMARAFGEQIGLIVTDVVMPVMGGMEMSDLLREEWPEIKVLFVSGYADEAIAARGVDMASASFLAKPFTVEGLAGKVHDMIVAAGGHQKEEPSLV